MNEGLRTRASWTRRRKILVGFLVLAGVAMAVIMPGLFWELHEANTSLRSFIGALVAKQYGPAYELTCKEFQASVDFSKFVKVHDSLIVRMGDLKGVEITKSEIKDRSDGWHGAADADLKFSRGTLHFIFNLKKENGAWRIYSYHEE